VAKVADFKPVSAPKYRSSPQTLSMHRTSLPGQCQTALPSRSAREPFRRKHGNQTQASATETGKCDVAKLGNRGLEIIFAEGRAADGTDPVRHVAPFHPEKMAVDVP